MKQDITLLAIIFVLCGVIMGSAVWVVSTSSSFTPDQATDTQSQDVLNTQNILPRINAARSEAGLGVLTEDAALEAKARSFAEAAAKDDAPLTPIVRGGSGATSAGVVGFTAPFSTLHGSYYSSADFVAMALVSPVEKAVLLADGKKAGIWVAYIIRAKGDKPVPFVTVLVQ